MLALFLYHYTPESQKYVKFELYRAKGRSMTVHFAVQPLLSIVAGVLILIKPRLLNYIVAIYLIVIGIVELIPQL